jgi:hypothetical protein
VARYEIHQKDGNQDTLVGWLSDKGCVYEHVGRPVDGFLAIPTKAGYVVAAVEIKTLRGKLEPAQVAFFERWPGPKYILRTQLHCSAMLAEMNYVKP